MDGYSAEIEQKMQRFFGWLSEKDRRRYAAVEAAKLGHGGVGDIARVLGCDPQTIRQGLRGLEEAEDFGAGPIRKKHISPDLVVKSQATDIIVIFLQLIRRQ